MSYYLGVDGGTTQTRAAVVCADGTVCGYGRSGRTNLHFVEIGTARRHLRAAVRGALTEAGVAPGAVRRAYLGLAGNESTLDHAFYLALGADIVSDIPHTLGHDGDTARMAGLSGAVGIAVDAGTGVQIVAQGPSGPPVRYIERGVAASGFALGRQALALANLAHLGLGGSSVVAHVLELDHGLGTLQQLLAWQTARVDAVASLAVSLSKAAEAGDTLASGALDAAGRELGLAVLGVALNVGLLDTASIVAMGGGVGGACRILREACASVIRAGAPCLTLRPPSLPTAVAAAALAAQEDALSSFPAMLAVLRETCHTRHAFS